MTLQMPPDQPADPAPQRRIALDAGLTDAKAFIRRPMFWTLITGAVFLAAFSGPFDTLQGLGFAARLLYWGSSIVFASVLASMASRVLHSLTRPYGIHWIVPALAAGVLVVPFELALVSLLEWSMVPSPFPDGFLALVPRVALPVIIITLLVNAFFVRAEGLRAAPAPVSQPKRTLEPPPATDVTAPLLFQRLPEQLGLDVVCLRAQDHYLEVTTTLGSALVLMRLSDAERDLGTIRGMRVHRSWWVALDHVAEFSRAEGGGISLTTTTGHRVPVARSQREALRVALGQIKATAE